MTKFNRTLNLASLAKKRGQLGNTRENLNRVSLKPMENETVFQSDFQPDVPDEVSVLRKQLAISLKFHHSSTLERLPIEVAVQVMAEVWDACNRNSASRQNGARRHADS